MISEWKKKVSRFPPPPPADLGPKKEEKRNQREKNVFLSLSLSTHPGWSASPLGFAWYSIDGS